MSRTYGRQLRSRKREGVSDAAMMEAVADAVGTRMQFQHPTGLKYAFADVPPKRFTARLDYR